VKWKSLILSERRHYIYPVYEEWFRNIIISCNGGNQQEDIKKLFRSL